MKVILLNGPTGSGKDTTAAYLKEIASRDKFDFIQTISIAAPIKQTMNTFIKANNINVELSKKDKPVDIFNNKTLRDLYILFGKTIRDFTNKDFFVDLVINQIRIAANYYKNPLIIITDLGMQDEHDAFANVATAKNWTIVKVKRSGCSFKNDCRESVKVDINRFAVAYLENNGTISNLKKKIENIAYFAGVLHYE